ncbi:lipoprotein [Caballeronia glebae]|uniref:Lipoprotein n=1 Tax=Caballeronia glebae TaxID=1777143 RepID=A0A158DU49_9BURK|nr:DUF6396 domain-containing protein [Caballeronia glebae]SAK98141.1 lipoprotein [Caballeronia glebae]
MPNLSDVERMRANLAFTCAHEADRLPALDPEADSLFRYGRYLQTSDGPKDYDDIARYFRIAAAHGHYKANHNVQQLISRGRASSPDARREAVGWAEQLVNQGIPIGYYDIGYYLSSGYGLKQDREMALKYIRKAADLGNADAQYYISDLLDHREQSPDIADQMLQCAAEGGHSLAAFEYGIGLKIFEKYQDALSAYQKGVMLGSIESAHSLGEAFRGPAKGALNFLNLAIDQERAERYERIYRFLSDNESSNPKVPDLDKIVPLPPAKLPPWDGTFEWERERAQIPEKPSDELIERLAKEKNLDSSTGLPLLSQGAAIEEKVSLGTTVRAFEVCPQTGVWRACSPSGYIALNAERTFRKGEKFPLLDVREPRKVAVLDSILGVRLMTVDGGWRLISYGDPESTTS